MPVVSLLKKPIFRIFFVVLFIISGIIIYQNWPGNNCNDCNLVLISVDTLRSDHMGVYGYDKNTTPNIDAWAKDAYVFTNAYTVAPVTYPSFLALMTGKNQFDTKVVNNSDQLINDGLITFPEVLKNNGYKNYAFITNKFLGSELTNLNRGFNEFNQYDYSENPIINKPDYMLFINQVNKKIEKIKKEKFFLWVHLMDPHSPYTPTGNFQCTYGKEYCQIINQKGLIELETERKKLEGCITTPLPTSDIKLFETLYDGGIATADSLIGEILDSIKKTGIEKKTIVVLLADHGEGFDHNYNFAHSHVLYNSNIKIPLIIKYPFSIINNLFSKTNSSIDKMILNTDISSTILSLLNISSTYFEKGNYNFSGIINWWHTYNERKIGFAASNDYLKYAIFDDKYKYIYSLPGACINNTNEELYDLKKDPLESVNIAEKEIRTSNDLKSKLLKYLHTYNFPPKLEEIEQKPTELINELRNLGY